MVSAYQVWGCGELSAKGMGHRLTGCEGEGGGTVSAGVAGNRCAHAVNPGADLVAVHVGRGILSAIHADNTGVVSAASEHGFAAAIEAGKFWFAVFRVHQATICDHALTAMRSPLKKGYRDRSATLYFYGVSDGT